MNQCCQQPRSLAAVNVAAVDFFWMVVEAGLGGQPLTRIAKTPFSTTVASGCYGGASAKLNAMDGLGEPGPPGTWRKRLN